MARSAVTRSAFRGDSARQAARECVYHQGGINAHRTLSYRRKRNLGWQRGRMRDSRPKRFSPATARMMASIRRYPVYSGECRRCRAGSGYQIRAAFSQLALAT